MNKKLALALFALLMPLAYADQGGLTNSGGSLAGGTSVANPAGTLTIAGNTLTFVTTDGSTAINATFATSSTVESCSGGGKGGHITCYFTFTGSFSGTLTVNGATQAINGSTRQVYGTDGVVSSGTTGYNSAYTPFYFTDGNARILRSDDLSGTNAIAYGTQGTGIGQFYGPSGIALDSAGRIYITDTYNDRIVRIDDMNGTNWTSFGTYGAGVGQFAIPQSISIDPAGRIWVLDNGNGRLIRMDDMNGTNWTTVGRVGSGVGQFGALSSAPGFDALGRIYVADTGNRWIARFDDLNFTNWTTLSQSQPIGPYIFLFGGPIGVVTDQAGKIYVADGAKVIRVDDMTGANWTSISLGTFSPHTIAIDSSGMVVLGNGYNAQIVDSEAAVLTSNITGLVQGVYVSVYGAVPISLPSPRPSAISFSPPALSFSQNVGATSPPQTVTVANFGGSLLSINGISTGGGFAQTNSCPSVLPGGSSCAVSVTFTPVAAGTVNGQLNVTDDSSNAGPAQAVTLTGAGTAPAASVSPTSLHFSSQIVGTTSAAKSVTLQSTGTGPLQVTNVTATAPFSQTNNCIGSIAAGASCTIQVSFTPTAIGSASGSLTITDDAGTQTVSLSGTGSGPVSWSPSELDFGTVPVGATSAAKTATLTNGGSASVSIAGITASAGFAIASSTCGASLAAGASCTVGVTFTPTTGGSVDGTLTATDSAAGSPQVTVLTGRGGVPATVSPSGLNFGAVAVGSISSPQTVTLTNGAGAALTFSSIVTTAGFSIASNTCGGGIGSGASCTVGVTFSPAAGGTINGTLTFTDSASNSPQTVSLTGTGSTLATVSPTSLNFGQVRVGHASSAKTVTLTNSGGASLSFSSITASASFAISSNTCGASLAAGANCTVGVTFTPAAKGTINGTLIFTDTALNSPQTVSLTGTGK